MEQLPVDVGNAAMQVIPGSHLNAQVPFRDSAAGLPRVFARSTRFLAGGRRCLAGPRTIERETQLANVDLNEGVLSKGRETLGEPTPSLTDGGFGSHRQTIDKGLRQSRSSPRGNVCGNDC